MWSSCNGFYKKVMVCMENVVARGEGHVLLVNGFHKEYCYRHRKHRPNATKVTVTATLSTPMYMHKCPMCFRICTE